MVAAAIVPSVVQKTNLFCTGITGTPMRLVKYYFVVTKVTAADWIVAATYFEHTAYPILFNAVTIDSSSNGVHELTTGVSYTHSGTLLILGSATVGTTYGEVIYEA